MTTPAADLRVFEPIIRLWKTSGTVFDERGTAIQTISGTDEYEWMVGGHWVIHRIDVMMGDQRSQGLELIGDRDAGTGRYRMRAFDAGGFFSTMTALPQADGSFLIEADGVRTTFTPPGSDRPFMTAVWERQMDDRPGAWVRWMDVRLDPIES